MYFIVLNSFCFNYTHVTVCVRHTEIKGYLFTYLLTYLLVFANQYNF